jgi:hypothetical protein
VHADSRRRAAVGSPADVLRLIALLLTREELTVGQFARVAAEVSATSGEGAAPLGEFPLLESLVQSLAEDPGRLDAVHTLVEDLRRTEEGRKLLPEGFAAIWDPVWTVRREAQP